MKCPQCQKEGEKSTVAVGCSHTTLMCTHSFYDEDGKLHHHDPNTTNTNYSCSRGHEWTEVLVRRRMRTPPKIVAVIPAKGSSDRLPGKNTKLLCGKTLPQWAIETAIASELITDIVLTTDSEEIRDTAGQYQDVVVVDRPPKLSAGEIGAADPVLHALRTLEYSDDSIVVILLPDFPLRTTEDIDKTIRVFLENDDADLAKTAVLVHFSPVSQGLLGENGRYQWYDGRSEQLASRPWHSHTAIALAMRVDFMAERTEAAKGSSWAWMSKDTVLYGVPVPRMHAMQIHTQESFEYAEVFMQKRLERKNEPEEYTWLL